ncbi:hypothetical protein L208DRAFT_1374459 [Tricholoma matsutake]|nr:hypothetical protein L208DRAFT_1374459 [Tricholoma matsutake 945]
MPVDILAVDIPPFPTSWLLFDSKSNTLLPKNIMVTRYPYLPMLDTIKPTVKWIGTEHCRIHPSAFEDFVTHDTMSFSDFIHRGIVDQKTHTSAWSYYKIYVHEERKDEAVLSQSQGVHGFHVISFLPSKFNCQFQLLLNYSSLPCTTVNHDELAKSETTFGTATETACRRPKYYAPSLFLFMPSSNTTRHTIVKTEKAKAGDSQAIKNEKACNDKLPASKTPTVCNAGSAADSKGQDEGDENFKVVMITPCPDPFQVLLYENLPELP